MTESPASTAPPRSLFYAGTAALVWNLIGVMTFAMQAMMGPDALAEMTEAERALYASIPLWATAAYGVAVLAGVAGSIGLLIRRAWAVPAFAVSLVAILVQMGHAVLLSEMMAVRGPSAALMPVVIIVVAAYLLWYATAARRQGWLG